MLLAPTDRFLGSDKRGKEKLQDEEMHLSPVGF
jgi:hypothetical protein